MKRVLITDRRIQDPILIEQRFVDADHWAQKHCISYVGYTVNDVSDFSYECDNIGSYEFTDDQDAMMFTLRWE